MRLRKRHLVTVLLVIALALGGWAAWRHVNRPYVQARRLVDEFADRPPEGIDKWLVRLGVRHTTGNLDDDQWRARFVELGQVLNEVLIDDLRSGDLERQDSAFEVLFLLNLDVSVAAPAAVVALTMEGAQEGHGRSDVLQLFYNMGSKGSYVAPKLVAIVRDAAQPTRIRTKAAHALVTVAPDTALSSVLDVLERWATGTDDVVGHAAGHELMRLAWRSPRTESLAPMTPEDLRGVLRRVVVKGTPSARREVSGALENVSGTDDKTVRAMMDALDDPSADVRLAAINILEKRRARPALRRVMESAARDGDAKVRDHAAEAATWLAVETETKLTAAFRKALLERQEKVHIVGMPFEDAIGQLTRQCNIGHSATGMALTRYGSRRITVIASDLTNAEAWCRLLVAGGPDLVFKIEDRFTITTIDRED